MKEDNMKNDRDRELQNRSQSANNSDKSSNFNDKSDSRDASRKEETS